MLLISCGNFWNEVLGLDGYYLAVFIICSLKLLRGNLGRSPECKFFMKQPQFSLPVLHQALHLSGEMGTA